MDAADGPTWNSLRDLSGVTPIRKMGSLRGSRRSCFGSASLPYLTLSGGFLAPSRLIDFFLVLSPGHPLTAIHSSGIRSFPESLFPFLLPLVMLQFRLV